MKALEDLKELLVDQIKRVTKKGDITPNELESMNKAVDIIKDISTITAMEKAEKEEEEYAKDRYSRGRYSREGSYDGNSMRGSYDGNSMRGGSYDGNMMSNDMGNSQRYLPYPMYSYAPVWNTPQQQPDNNQNQNNEMNGNSQGYNAGNSNANNGMSNDGRRGRDADSDGRYSEDNSYRRGRDAMGRFTSRDGSYENSSRYSRHSVKDRMIAKLEDMADDATTNRERNTIMQCIDKLDN